MCDLLGWIDFFAASSFARGPHILLRATSAPFPAGCLSLSRARVRLGAVELHTLSISSKKLHSLPQALAFLAELHRGSSKAPRLKSAVWSMVITSGVLNPHEGGREGVGGVVEEAMRWVGERAGLRQTPNLFPVMAWYPPPPSVCVSTVLNMLALNYVQMHVLKTAVGVIWVPRRAWYQHTVWDQFNFG